nr:peptide chain release factor N(5)-glutamine methyltransferase [Devosia sp. MC532]
MTAPLSIGAVWRACRDVLAKHDVATATLDAKLLVGHALGLDALGLMTREMDGVSEAQREAINATISRRLTGESVARIIGYREFYGLNFKLSAATLEPRPDTELLVDLAIKALPKGGRLLDLGTGTGCIPISILANRPDGRGHASDINPEALAMAQENARANGVSERLSFSAGSWFEALEGVDRAARFDLIVSNPPYIVSEVINTLADEVKNFDPMLALDGGPDGVAPYRILAAQAGGYLKADGVVLVEIGYDQANEVSALFANVGFSQVRVHKDYGGLDRVVEAHHKA